MTAYSPYAAGISGYGYGADTSGFGSSMGASNPTSAALQSFSAGNGAWDGLRNQTGTIADMNIPKVGSGVGGTGDASGLGFNVGTGKLVLGGIQAIGNLWAAWQANKNAREQFAFQKDVTNTNLANQMKAYNTTLEDRINSRYFTEGKSTDAASAYIADHKLSRSAAA